MPKNLEKIDHSAMKVSQVTIVILNILAFVLNAPWLALLVMLVLLLGTFLKVPGFGFIYRYVLKPLGWVKPQVLLDHPEPHRFAQGFGAFVMAAGSLSLFLGATGLGWGLVWLVAALAALNAFAGFCAGCAVYYWLNRLKVPGFHQSPPAGTFPGMRPKGAPVHESLDLDAPGVGCGAGRQRVGVFPAGEPADPKTGACPGAHFEPAPKGHPSHPVLHDANLRSMQNRAAPGDPPPARAAGGPPAGAGDRCRLPTGGCQPMGCDERPNHVYN